MVLDHSVLGYPCVRPTCGNPDMLLIIVASLHVTSPVPMFAWWKAHCYAKYFAKHHDVTIDSTFVFYFFMFCALHWQMLLGDRIPSLERLVADAYSKFGIDFKSEKRKMWIQLRTRTVKSSNRQIRVMVSHGHLHHLQCARQTWK